MTSNESNITFRHQILGSYVWLKPRLELVCGYSTIVVLERLMQCLVTVALPKYARIAYMSSIDGNCSLADFETGIDTARATIADDGSVQITSRQLAHNLGDFFLHWAYCLVSIFLVRTAQNNDAPSVLLYGVGEESLFEEGNDARFVRFCHSGPILPLSKGRRFIVQSGGNCLSSEPRAFTYARDPLIRLISETSIGIAGRANLLFCHCGILFKYLLAVWKTPQLSVLGKDFAYTCIARKLDNLGRIEAIILSAAVYSWQPLWLRELREATTHMVWYSQSAKPIVYSSDHMASDMPSFEWIRVNQHWVWTKAFASYLGTLLPNVSIEAVGPIVWYLPEIDVAPDSSIQVAIIDVPPCSDQVSLDNGVFPNFHHPAKLTAFIEDILELKPLLEETFGKSVILRLKTKRGYRMGYDAAYFDYLDSLASNNSIVLESHKNNLFSLISKSHLAIIYPFSSPAYIADALGIRSIYYDPTGSIDRYDFGDSPSLIEFAKTKEELRNMSVAALSALAAEANGRRRDGKADH